MGRSRECWEERGTCDIRSAHILAVLPIRGWRLMSVGRAEYHHVILHRGSYFIRVLVVSIAFPSIPRGNRCGYLAAPGCYMVREG